MKAVASVRCTSVHYLLYRQQRDNQAKLLALYGFLRYKKGMAKRRGRPPVSPEKTKADYLEVRLESAEKQAFKDAADFAGLALSAWVRERLRLAARRELEKLGKPVAFLS